MLGVTCSLTTRHVSQTLTHTRKHSHTQKTHLCIRDAEVSAPWQQERRLLVPKHQLADVDETLESFALLELLVAVLGLVALCMNWCTQMSHMQTYTHNSS